MSISMKVIMKKLLYVAVAVVEICEISEGMLPNERDLFQSRGFCFGRVRNDTVRVSSDIGVLDVTATLLGKMLLCKENINVEDPVFYQINQNGRLGDLKEGILDFLHHEEEDSVDKIGISTTAWLTIDEIIRDVTSDDGMIYSVSKDSIFAGTAVNSMRNNLNILKERIRENINYYDERVREQLLETMQTEINGLNKVVLYAYDELPDYSTEQVANYVSYYTNAISKLEEIVECFR